MTSLEFHGPGLSAEQWDQLNTLAVSLRSGQALWLSGYFAGLDHSARAETTATMTSSRRDSVEVAPPAAAQARSLTILYGSETGNSTALAKTLAATLKQQGREPVLVDMADYKPRKLKDEQDLLIISSTHGEGDPPLSSVGFYEFIESRKAPQLPDVRFAVLALGDSTYERYCEAGKRLDRRLEELGAKRLADRIDCDVDYDEPAANWIAATSAVLAPEPTLAPTAPGEAVTHGTAPKAAITTTEFDKRHPFQAAIIDNLVLTGRGSSKETRHVELSLDGSGLTYQPGDALGLMPSNDPALVDSVLNTLALDADAPVTVKSRTLPLRQALSEACEITAATPRFLDLWAQLSSAKELESLRDPAQAEQRAAFLQSHHVIDIVRRFPVSGIDASSFVAGLRPLQPRLYSIASSLDFAPDEAHLVVSTVRYDLHGEPRTGVASGHLAAHAEPGATLPVYIQSNPHFRLPKDGAPILMIGAGTGVAPYRAFMQQREASGISGKSWLLFGDRNFQTDFLYQTEWQGWLKDGTLSRMNVAFSRDHAAKVYVQHRLREHAREVYAWLEDGAHIYLCGDGTYLAPDVHAALTDIVAEQGGLSAEAARDYLAALKRDHRYQTDVY